MVSRQETARPLLTQGEVMQLPPAEELVLVSGMAPIRAKKLQYYKDANFRARLVPPPALANGDYPDRPKGRPDDWTGIVRTTDPRVGEALASGPRTLPAPPQGTHGARRVGNECVRPCSSRWSPKP